jgi:hypothetical protein
MLLGNPAFIATPAHVLSGQAVGKCSTESRGYKSMPAASDLGRYQKLLHDLVVRLATQLAQSGPDGKRFLQKVRQQDVEAGFHEIADDALRMELQNLSTLLHRIAVAGDHDLAATERHFRGRANYGTRGRLQVGRKGREN